jgi:hypothetical protein
MDLNLRCVRAKPNRGLIYAQRPDHKEQRFISQIYNYSASNRRQEVTDFISVQLMSFTGYSHVKTASTLIQPAGHIFLQWFDSLIPITAINTLRYYRKHALRGLEGLIPRPKPSASCSGVSH